MHTPNATSAVEDTARLAFIITNLVVSADLFDRCCMWKMEDLSIGRKQFSLMDAGWLSSVSHRSLFRPVRLCRAHAPCQMQN